MTDGLIGESVQGFVGQFADTIADIAGIEPIIREELLKMPNETFWDTVCHSVIGHTPEEVPEGTHLFQCSWNNRQLFNDRSRDAEYMKTHNGKHEYMIANDPGVPERRKEVHPEVMVNIAGLARFSMTCPCGEMEKCPRRNVQFGQGVVKRDTQRDSMLVRETERIK